MSSADTGEATTSPAAPWRLRRRLGRSFLGFLLIFIAAATVMTGSAVKFAGTGNDVIYTYQPATNASQRLLADLVNQETGVRGYVLTHQAQSLRPYTDYRVAERSDRAQLDRRITGDPHLQGLAAEFASACTAWQRDIAVPLIDDVRSGAHPSVSALDAGRHQFDTLRRRSATLTAALDARTRAARADRTKDGAFFAVSLGLLLVITLVVGVIILLGLRRWVLDPVDRLGEQTRHVAGGDLTRRIEPHGPGELVELGRDVEAMRERIASELARAEALVRDLHRQGEELQRSNADLQQFAYVASHDLSEPLRKVANFCQLLERQYAEQLDDRARQYIGYAVDGAKRMQALINDLLALSRVGRTTDNFREVELQKVYEQAVTTLAERIRTVGATVECLTPLPVVVGDRSLLASLFENVIGNAVKYHREDVVPVVQVSAEFADGVWTMTVRDNGIGIDPQYAERIFAVFQRLHLRDQYGGTGIGLALCRRIVEFHEGRIWLDTVGSVSGATFCFTLPEGGPRAPEVSS